MMQTGCIILCKPEFQDLISKRWELSLACGMKVSKLLNISKPVSSFVKWIPANFSYYATYWK